MSEYQATYCLFLSAGRTGSTYMSHFFEAAYENVSVYAEVEPSRVIKGLHNISLLRNKPLNVIAGRLARSWYHSSRERWRSRATLERKTHFIEINPFLVGLGAELHVVPVDSCVAMVRNPVAWVESAIRFGSYSWRRPVVPYLPFVRERPSIGHPKWAEWGELERFAWRWKFRNEAMLEYLDELPTGTGMLVKYEDLFVEGATEYSKIENIVRHLGLEDRDLENTMQTLGAINPSKEKHTANITEENREQIMEICGPIASRLGYT